ncbi:RPM1 interacting protein 13-like isoform X2 [Carex rostrata]
MAVEADPPLNLVEISSDSEEDGEKMIKFEKSCGKKGLKKRYAADVEIWTEEEKQINDDECCILPSDPAGEIDLRHPVSDPKQDDVSVLGERGKVACRDYPHPRHSCAKYLFSETSHENCCSQCYCYVCDVSAPCSNWKGPNGHCHASSQEKGWSARRRAMRQLTKWQLNHHSTKTGQ